MDPNHYQQYADFYWHNYPESASTHWDYPPLTYYNRGLPGANAAGSKRANTKEVFVVDSPTDSEGENADQLKDDREKSEVGY